MGKVHASILLITNHKSHQNMMDTRLMVSQRHGEPGKFFLASHHGLLADSEGGVCIPLSGFVLNTVDFHFINEDCIFQFHCFLSFEICPDYG